MEAAMQKVQKEVALKRIAGPFEAPPLEHFKCSPLSMREKSTPGQFCLLHNLSYPHDDTAVNANIPVHKAKTSYSNIDDALDDLPCQNGHCGRIPSAPVKTGLLQPDRLQAQG